MKRKVIVLAAAVLTVTPTAAWAGTAYGHMFVHEDVRYQFNLCESPRLAGKLVPCWAPGLF
jgi:hypothetical protein